MTTYRIYGPAKNNGSFGRLAKGFIEGLKELGNKVHFCPTDLETDEDLPTGGSTASVAIHVGNPLCAAHMVTRGKHKLRFSMLAPNSNNVPDWVFQAINRAQAQIITPSRWGASVIRKYSHLTGRSTPIVVPHGVSASFREARYPRAPQGAIRALHVTNTKATRKQTVPLIREWLSNSDSRNDYLYIKTDIDTWSHVVGCIPEVRESTAVLPILDGDGRFGGPGWDAPEQIYGRFDVVIQPSRTEGFGLVPLEAIACGVPAVIGACTGCLEYASERLLEHVYPWDFGDLEDEDFSDEPEIDCSEAVNLAIENVELRRGLKDDPMVRHIIATGIVAKWRWENVLADFSRYVDRELAR